MHGGYDRSGFASRVFKLGGQPQGPQITGRTAAGQAGEIARGARVRADAVAPADVRSSARAASAAGHREADPHMGIALSEEFMIQSSRSYGGVSVAPLFTRDARRSSVGAAGCGSRAPGGAQMAGEEGDLIGPGPRI